MISFAQAQDKLHQLCRTWLVTHPDVSEPLALSESLGRYLTEDVIAALDLPRSVHLPPPEKIPPSLLGSNRLLLLDYFQQ